MSTINKNYLPATDEEYLITVQNVKIMKNIDRVFSESQKKNFIFHT